MKPITKLLVCLATIATGLFIGCQTAEKDAEVANNKYQIVGKVTNADSIEIVILSQFNPIKQTRTALDTAVISSNGQYKLEYDFTEPDLFQLRFDSEQTVTIVVNKDQDLIRLDVEGKSKGNVKSSGSEDAQKLIDYDAFRQESYNRVVKGTYDAMRAATDIGDHEAEIEAVQNYAHASEDHRRELIDYSAKNIGTSIALYGSMLRWTGDDEISQLAMLVDAFKKAHPNLKMTKIMEDKVKRFKVTAIGSIAPAISLSDTLGTMRNLQDLKGKYTLIDFWASWCTPCILQIPDLKEAYEKYGDQGFEIVGVSVDSREQRWKSAIQKHDMQWPNISDVSGWGSAAAADYNVTFIPFNVLIDADGKIVAKNLHSKALVQKLESLL